MARMIRMSSDIPSESLRVPAQARQAAARELGLNEQYLYQLLTRRGRAPLERCPAIEQALKGVVTCEQLRPDVHWARIPDGAWPHPAGRPVIDVARQLSSHAAQAEAA
jgi:DNA-binding transcriptional regulator YdaS (Cro superfamily)